MQNFQSNGWGRYDTKRCFLWEWKSGWGWHSGITCWRYLYCRPRWCYGLHIQAVSMVPSQDCSCLLSSAETFRGFRKGGKTFVSKLFLVLARSCYGKARRREKKLYCRFHSSVSSPDSDWEIWGGLCKFSFFAWKPDSSLTRWLRQWLANDNQIREELLWIAEEVRLGE